MEQSVQFCRVTLDLLSKLQNSPGKTQFNSTNMALSPDRKQQYESFFRKADTNGDGSVTQFELAKVLQEVSYRKCTPDEIVEMFDGCDHNKDGKITMEEFLREMGKADRRKGYEEIFRKWDTDGSGHLSRDEVHKACKEARSGLTDDEIDRHIKKLDKDGDGQISLKEFLKLV